MDEKFLKLTNLAYKAVDFFPDAEPVKEKAKEKVLSVMESLILIYGTEGWASLQIEKAKTQAIEDIEMLLGYLSVARMQNWLSALNFIIFSGEYEKIKNQIKPDIFLKIKEKQAKLSERQEKIIKFLEDNGDGQVMDLQKALLNVTKRTIRRDLDELMEIGKIERFGEFNRVIYRIKG